MKPNLSPLDWEARRIRQWIEFLVVAFGLMTILTLVVADVWSLVPVVVGFVWGLAVLHKDAVALDEERRAQQRYQTWRETQAAKGGF